MRWLGLVVPLFVAACSSESTPITPAGDTGPGDAGCVRYDGGPAVSLVPVDAGEDAPAMVPDSGPIVTKAEIDDILALSCSFTSCHGRAPGAGKLYLPKAPENWVVEVVNKASVEHPTMKRIVPGDPSNSFFVHKLTDGLCALQKECVGGDCGVRMPQGSDALLAEDFDKIVRWIRQGASEK